MIDKGFELLQERAKRHCFSLHFIEITQDFVLIESGTTVSARDGEPIAHGTELYFYHGFVTGVRLAMAGGQRFAADELRSAIQNRSGLRCKIENF